MKILNVNSETLDYEHHPRKIIYYAYFSYKKHIKKLGWCYGFNIQKIEFFYFY